MPKKLEVHSFRHEAMATVFEIFVAGKTATYSGQAARAAFDEIDRIERLFSRFDPSSELSRLNRLRPEESMRVGVEILECLSLSVRMQEETHGAFDVNYRALEGGAAGRGKAVASIPRARERRPPAARPRTADQEGPRLEGPARAGLFELVSFLDVPGGLEIVRLPPGGRKNTAGLDLDLGAVGKGYALDSALDILRDWDVDNVLLHAGTSTALGVGPGPDGKGWPVGIATSWSCPDAPDPFLLRDMALSGSGTEVKGSHILDPRAGRPARRFRATWAAHPLAAVADALSTALFAMTLGEIGRFSSRRPEAWALVIRGPKKC